LVRTKQEKPTLGKRSGISSENWKGHQMENSGGPVVTGGKMYAKYHVLTPCDICKGDIDPKCPKCNGTGTYLKEQDGEIEVSGDWLHWLFCSGASGFPTVSG